MSSGELPMLPELIERDLPCRKCGYNLRGLGGEGMCPECGSPVATAVFGDLLKYSLPTWVRGLARGAKFVYYGWTVIVASIVMVFLAIVVLGGLFGPHLVSLLVGMIFVAAGLGLLSGGVFAIIGWWLLTIPDPSGLGEFQYGTARRIIRITLIIWVGETILSLAADSAAVPPTVHQAIRILDIATALAFAIGLGAQMRYLGKLCARLPDQKLTERALGLGTVYPVCYVLMQGSWHLSTIMGVFAPGRWTIFNTVMPFLGCIGLVAALGSLICFLRYLRIMRDLMRRFGAEAAISDRLWATRPRNVGNSISPSRDVLR